MPRIIYDPNTGNDVTAAAKSVLLGSQTAMLCNLYSFANRVFWADDPVGNIGFWSFTDADFPVAASYLQLFASGAVEISTLNGGSMLYTPNPSGGVVFRPGGGENDGGFKHSGLTYSVGLEANNVDVTWFVDDAADYFSPITGAYPPLINPPLSILGMKHAMAYYRAFDDCPFWIHRCIFDPYLQVWPGCCIACWTDGTGQIVAGTQPFITGNGIAVTVPAGATQLQMGINDFPYNDNTGQWNMLVNGNPVIVSATAVPWVYSGGSLNAAFPLPSSGASSPTVVAGLTAGQTVTIEYVNGLSSLHFGVPPFFGPIGVVGYPNTAVLSTPGQYAISTILSTYPTLLGTTLMYRGYVRNTESAADYLKISLGSLMQILQDTQVPNQLVQANSRQNPFLPFPNVAAATLTPYPSAGTIIRVSAKTYTFGGSGITANQLQDSWITFNPAASSYNFAPQSGLPPICDPGWRIQSNTASSGGSLNITFYDPPVVPGDVQQVNLFSAGSQTSGPPGFPNLPPPENIV